MQMCREPHLPYLHLPSMLVSHISNGSAQPFALNQSTSTTRGSHRECNHAINSINPRLPPEALTESATTQSRNHSTAG